MVAFFGYYGLCQRFFGAVFCIEQLQCVVETFLACFYAFLILDPVTILQSLQPLLGGHFWQFSKWSHFWNISCFLEPFFAQNNCNVLQKRFKHVFLHFKFWTQSDDFAKSIAFAWWPFLAIFKMVSFLEYQLLFGAVFCIEQLQCVVETFLACFYAFLILDPK